MAHPLLDALEQHCSTRATRPAVSDPGLTLDYRRFHAVATALGEHIAAQAQGPHVGILAPTSAAGGAAIFACWYAGTVPVPLNFMLAAPELRKVIDDAQLDTVLVDERLAALAATLGVKRLPLEITTRSAGRRPPPDVAPSDLAALMYTSGTFGDPKGVCLTFDNLVQNARACSAAAELAGDQVFLGLLPQFHAYGLTATTIVPLLLGATVHYLPRFSPAAVINLIAQERVSVLITIASMYAALAASKNASREHFASLTHPISGGEPLPPRVDQTWQERFGVRIYEGYGMTEASPVISLNTPRAYRPRSVGRPLPGVYVAVVDEAGRELPAGREGELTVRGHCVMQGYFNKPAQTAAAIRNGALFTGDIGRVDADGFVYITGRAKEMLIVGGENVFPAEIEGVLAEHPAVGEVAVIGVPDDVRGEIPVAFITVPAGAQSPSEAELRGFCRERLAAYKVPRQIQVVSELPRGPTGKVLKRTLAGLLRPYSK